MFSKETKVVVWFFSRKVSIFVVISSQRGMLKVNPKATMHQTKEKFRIMAPLKTKSLQSYFIKLKKNLPRNFFEVFEATLAETRTYEPFALQRSLWRVGKWKTKFSDPFSVHHASTGDLKESIDAPKHVFTGQTLRGTPF